jgi:hypothetical protein
MRSRLAAGQVPPEGEDNVEPFEFNNIAEK